MGKNKDTEKNASTADMSPSSAKNFIVISHDNSVAVEHIAIC